MTDGKHPRPTRPYHTLLERDDPGAPWCQDFGDYERDVVEAELDDRVAANLGVASDAPDHWLIITTSDDQADINATIEALNRGVEMPKPAPAKPREFWTSRRLAIRELLTCGTAPDDVKNIFRDSYRAHGKRQGWRDSEIAMTIADCFEDVDAVVTRTTIREALEPGSQKG